MHLESEMAIIHPSSNPWMFTNGSTSAITGEEREKFKQALISYYGAECDGRGIICMVSGRRLDNSTVTAAHIWPAHARHSIVERWFNLDEGDLDSARNGILMAAPFEKQFDELRISFQWDETVEKFRCVILDKRLRSKGQIIPGLVKDDGTPFLYSDFHKQELVTPSGNLPFRRLLAYHYATAITWAAKRNWIDREKIDSDMFSSEEKVRAWLEGQSPGAKWPGLPSYHRHLIAGSNSGKSSTPSKGASSSNAASAENAAGK